MGDRNLERVYRRTITTSRYTNFIYAAHITARTRLKLLDVLMKDYDHVVSLSTDCYVSDRYEGDGEVGLGKWKLDFKGEGVFIGSGVYSLRNENTTKTRFRGFNVTSSFNFFDLLENDGYSTRFNIPLKHVVGLGEAIVHNREFDFLDVNRMIHMCKILDLNFDRKRVWSRAFESGRDVLSSQIDSSPLVM
jgi:hypothetical protein